MKNFKKGDLVNARVDKYGHFKQINNAVVESVKVYGNYSEVHVVRGENTTVQGNMGFMGVDGMYQIECITLNNEAYLEAKAIIATDLYKDGKITRPECFRHEVDFLVGEDSGAIILK